MTCCVLERGVPVSSQKVKLCFLAICRPHSAPNSCASLKEIIDRAPCLVYVTAVISLLVTVMFAITFDGANQDLTQVLLYTGAGFMYKA